MNGRYLSGEYAISTLRKIHLPSTTGVKYLAVQDGAEEVGLVDLLTGRQNHFQLVKVAHSA